MNVYKVYGNYSDRRFLVSANTGREAVEAVETMLKADYTEEEILEMEFQINMDFLIDATETEVHEL